MKHKMNSVKKTAFLYMWGSKMKKVEISNCVWLTMVTLLTMISPNAAFSLPCLAWLSGPRRRGISY